MAVSQATQKGILTFFMFLNGFLTPGGLVYGWPGFAQSLKDEGIYSAGCPNYDPHGKSCPAQDDKLSLIPTVGFNLASVGTIVFGFTLDRYGPRNNAVVGAVMMCAGFVMCALSSDEVDAFVPGFSLIAFGGLGTYLPAFQFTALFSRPTQVLSIQSALYGLAGLTFTFFKFLLEDHGISRKASFLAYALAIAFCGLSMLLLYPSKAYKTGDTIHLPVLGWLGLQAPPQTGLDAHIVNGNGTGKSAADYSALSDDDELGIKEKDNKALDAVVRDTAAPDYIPHQSDIEFLKSERRLRDLTTVEFDQLKNSRTLREELFHPGTILVALHFSIGLLASNLYNVNITTLLSNMGDKGNYANSFVYIMSIYPMLFSLLIDPLQQKYRYAGTSFLSTLLLIAGTAFLFIDDLNAQIPAFFLLATGKTLLVTVMFNFVRTEYRSEHYGTIIAFVVTICTAIGLLQLGLQPLLTGPAHNNFDYFTAGMIIAMTPLLYFSYWCHKFRV